MGLAKPYVLEEATDEEVEGLWLVVCGCYFRVCITGSYFIFATDSQIFLIRASVTPVEHRCVAILSSVVQLLSGRFIRKYQKPLR